jgi:hypothetical protein
MSDRVLPTLLVHGDLVWKGCLVLLIAAVFLVVARVRRSRARRWARNVPAVLDLHSDRVVRGVLGGGAARSLCSDDEHRDLRDQELWIATPDGRIPLVGAIHVLAGTATTVARGRVPAETPRVLRRPDQSFTGVIALHRVSAGDEVIAHGTLERRPGVADYRSDGTTFTLVGAPIAICARTPAAALPRLAAVSIALIFATSLSIGYIAERALGAGWRGACATGKADACVLAATMPGGDTAGRLLLAVLDATHHNNREEVDHRVAVAEIEGNCDYAMRPLEQAQLWDELLATARRCNSPVEMQLALAELGRFAEATAFAPANPKLPRLSLLILAHEWSGAADELDKLGRERGSQARHHQLQCRAELFRAWAGDPEAGPRLVLGNAPAVEQAMPQIVMHAVEVCPGEYSLLDRQLDPWYDFGTTYGATRVAEVYATFAALDDDAVAVWGSRIWSSKFARLYNDDSPDALAIRDAQAIHRAMTGDLDGAYHDALANDELANRIYYVDERAPLASQLLLYTEATDIPHDLPNADTKPDAHDAWWHQLAHVFLRDGLTYAEHLDRHTRAALDTAQLIGDGRPLAARLPDDHELRDLDLLAVLPRVTRGRAALVEAIRWSVPVKDPLGLHGFPYVTATRAFTRRSVLELAGDHAGAARWSEVFRLYDRALGDPRTLVALALASAT